MRENKGIAGVLATTVPVALLAGAGAVAPYVVAGSQVALAAPASWNDLRNLTLYIGNQKMEDFNYGRDEYVKDFGVLDAAPASTEVRFDGMPMTWGNSIDTDADAQPVDNGMKYILKTTLVMTSNNPDAAGNVLTKTYPITVTYVISDGSENEPQPGSPDYSAAATPAEIAKDATLTYSNGYEIPEFHPQNRQYIVHVGTGYAPRTESDGPQFSGLASGYHAEIKSVNPSVSRERQSDGSVIDRQKVQFVLQITRDDGKIIPRGSYAIKFVEDGTSAPVKAAAKPVQQQAAAESQQPQAQQQAASTANNNTAKAQPKGNLQPTGTVDAGVLPVVAIAAGAIAVTVVARRKGKNES